MTECITITRPDDFHLHLRDGEILSAVLAHSAQRFARAIVMPNLETPVVSVEMALAYRERILGVLDAELDFLPLMTLYLTDNTSRDEIRRVADSPDVHAVKYYPAGATTNSENGVTAIEKIHPVLEEMEKFDVPLLVHGEVTDAVTDVFDREKVFTDRILEPLCKQFAGLRIVFEHVTTRDAVEFVQDSGPCVAATITAHHLLLNRNALFNGGLRPHNYCLPLLKAEEHRQALVEAATGGNKKFFLGTDSAPHLVTAKENDCGCAGIYSACNALEIYTEIFAATGKLDHLEAFASHHGADFYKLERNSGSVKLCRESWNVPATVSCTGSVIVPLRAGETCGWKLVDE